MLTDRQKEILQKIKNKTVTQEEIREVLKSVPLTREPAELLVQWKIIVAQVDAAGRLMCLRTGEFQFVQDILLQAVVAVFLVSVDNTIKAQLTDDQMEEVLNTSAAALKKVMLDMTNMLLNLSVKPETMKGQNEHTKGKTQGQHKAGEGKAS